MLLQLDLLTVRALGDWKVHAIVATMAGACIALWFSWRAWLLGQRLAHRPSERAHGAPTFLMGAPYIDLRLWAQVNAAVRAEFSSSPAPLPPGAPSNEWELTVVVYQKNDAPLCAGSAPAGSTSNRSTRLLDSGTTYR